MTADKIALWLAQGLGIGRIPIMPGTFGSVLGFFWFLLIVAPGNFAVFTVAILFGFFVSVLCSEIGEKILGQKDPGSIVIDEIIAIPVCFLGWMTIEPAISGPMWFLTEGRWKTTLAILVAFRVFDIWKPWPVRQSQRLPGGWGVTVDDVLAAIYVAVISGVLLARH
jgi:phosphatidylglycerophosphatase A